jgi:hypothetical protein
MEGAACIDSSTS